jgi:Plasmid pRiA4b ORF-3-like protein
MNAAAIARLKITLGGGKPLGMRRLEVPLSIRLDRLHLAIQAAMGWTNSHLYEIRAKDTGWGIPDPAWGGGPLDARKARLVDGLEDSGTKTLKYLYDCGGWEHTIKIERLIDPVPGAVYPRLIEALGRCPPEGGPWGYAEFLEAITGHDRHAEFKERIGEDFDANVIDADRLGEQVATSAKRWSRNATPKRSRLT